MDEKLDFEEATERKDKKTKRRERKEKLKLVAKFLVGAKKYYLVSILAAGITALCEMLSPQVVSFAVDNLTGATKDGEIGIVGKIANTLGITDALLDNLLYMAIALILIAFVGVVFKYLFRVSETRASETLSKNMRDSLFDRLMHLPFSWHTKNKTGDIIQRCTTDIDTTRDFISEQLTGILRIAFLLGFSTYFMLKMHPLLTLIAMLPVPIMATYSVLFHNKIGDLFEKCDESDGELSAVAQENITGVRVVRAFGLERREVDRFKAQNEDYTEKSRKIGKYFSLFEATNDVFSGVQILLILVFGSYFCIQGGLTEGEFLAFITYNTLLMWPIRELGEMITGLSKAGVSLDRMYYVMASPLEIEPVAALTPDMSGDIAFENVSFEYENGKKILDRVSFTVKSGTTLGIIGGTGSGKSTIAYLLERLYPLEEGCGKISVGGVDIKDIKTSHLRSSIGMVLQEPFLFSGTIADNIGIAASDMTMDDIRTAARTAALDETVMSFPSGYETVVGERGVTLSGGQCQRTAIARLLATDRKILIFDDSLSAVDAETDTKIRHALENNFKNATRIIISHRISTLATADKIILLENGKIVEQGTHDELKNAGGIYQRIYESQTLGGESANESI